MKTGNLGAPSLVLLALLVSACAARPAEPGPTVVRPGAPGEATRPESGEQTRPEPARHTAADVAFVQAMILHHAQALAMTELVRERTERTEIRRLAERVEASQESEIAQMRRWLERRGEPVPDADPHALHGAGHAGMPGMLTHEELQRLAAAEGTAFDRLFLEYMIRHHEGALTMVEQLFAAEGAGQEPELFQLASHIDADQRMEIARMRRLLETLPRGSE